MARLSKHGIEIARLEYVTSIVSIRSDGNIMKNDGFGWKLWKKCRPGITPETVAHTMKTAYTNLEQTNFLAWQYRSMIVGTIGIRNRWKLHETIKLMPDDPDGVWSTMDDAGCRVDLEDIVKLCQIYSVRLKDAADKPAEQAV